MPTAARCFGGARQARSKSRDAALDTETVDPTARPLLRTWIEAMRERLPARLPCIDRACASRANERCSAIKAAAR